MITPEEYAWLSEAAREEARTGEDAGVWEEGAKSKKKSKRGGKGRSNKPATEDGNAEAAVGRPGKGGGNEGGSLGSLEEGKGASDQQTKGGSSVHCSNCRRSGHTRRECPLKVRKGEELHERAASSVADVKSTSVSKPTSKVCHLCGKPGHLRADCHLGKSVHLPKCLKCGNEGHAAAECPLGGGSRDRCQPFKSSGQSAVARSTNSDRRRCTRCGGYDHLPDECPICKAGEWVCHNCKQPGHESKECPQPLILENLICRECKKPGHRQFECPQLKGAVGCLECGKAGHKRYDCPEHKAGFPCHECGKPGHFSKDCPDKTAAVTCKECRKTGHIARDCPEKRAAVTCNECGKTGHIARDCTERKCHECGSLEHFAKQCPVKVSQRGAQHTCKACGGFGHFTTDCPKERCHRCSDFGHIRLRCPYPGNRDLDVCWECKLPGHRKSQCLTTASECTFCGATEHVLESCPHKGEATLDGDVVGAANESAELQPTWEAPKVEESTSGWLEAAKSGTSFAAALRSGMWQRFEPEATAGAWGQAEASDVLGSDVDKQTSQEGRENSGRSEQIGAEEDSNEMEGGIDTAVFEELLSPGQVASNGAASGWADESSFGEQKRTGAASWQHPIGSLRRPLSSHSEEYVPSSKAGRDFRAEETPKLPLPGRRESRPLSANSQSWQASPVLALSALRNLQRTPSSERSTIGVPSQDVRRVLPASGSEMPWGEEGDEARPSAAVRSSLEVPRGDINCQEYFSSQRGAAAELLNPSQNGHEEGFNQERVDRLMDRVAHQGTASWQHGIGAGLEHLPGDDIFEPSADFVSTDADAEGYRQDTANEFFDEDIVRGVLSDTSDAGDAAWSQTAVDYEDHLPQQSRPPLQGSQQDARNARQAGLSPDHPVGVIGRHAPRAPPPGFQKRSELSSSPPLADKARRPPPGFFAPPYPPAPADSALPIPVGLLAKVKTAALAPIGKASTRRQPSNSAEEQTFSPLSTDDPVFKSASTNQVSSGPFAFGHPLDISGHPTGLAEHRLRASEPYTQRSAFAEPSSTGLSRGGSAEAASEETRMRQGFAQGREWSAHSLPAQPDHVDGSRAEPAAPKASLPPSPHEVLRRLLPQTAIASTSSPPQSSVGMDMHYPLSRESFESGRFVQPEHRERPLSFYPPPTDWAPQHAEGPPFLRQSDAHPSFQDAMSAPQPAKNASQQPSFSQRMGEENQGPFNGPQPFFPPPQSAFPTSSQPPPFASLQSDPHILALRAKVHQHQQRAQYTTFQGGPMPPSSDPLQPPHFENAHSQPPSGWSESRPEWSHVPGSSMPAESLDRISGDLPSAPGPSGWTSHQEPPRHPFEDWAAQNGGFHPQTSEDMRTLFPREQPSVQTRYSPPDTGPIGNGQVSQPQRTSSGRVSERKSAYNPMQWQKDKAQQVVSEDPDGDLERLLRENGLMGALQPEGAHADWSNGGTVENGEVTPLAVGSEHYAPPAAEAVPQREDQFEADLQAAMNLSLEEYKSQEASDLLELQKKSWPVLRPAGKKEVVGKGLANRTGEYNCFLNVVIQSLWHLVPFRQSIASQPLPKRRLPREQPSSRHLAVLKGLGQIFRSLSADDGKPTAVDPSALRTALHDAHAGSDLFQIEEMNDASEVLLSIFSCLHESLLLLAPSQESANMGNGLLPTPSQWHAPRSKALKTTDVCSGACFVHDLFGLDMQEYTHCPACNRRTHKLHYQQFFHLVNCSALCEATAQFPALPFARLLSGVLTNSTPLRPCDKDEGGCGELIPTSHVLDRAPKLFTVVLVWGSAQASQNQVRSVVSAIGTRICVSDIFPNLADRSEHALRCVVCYYGLHYFAFAFSTKAQQWIYLDDTNVKVVGTWDKVVEQCTNGRLQPSVLFYEAQ